MRTEKCIYSLTITSRRFTMQPMEVSVIRLNAEAVNWFLKLKKL